jgi:hypothetical protein
MEDGPNAKNVVSDPQTLWKDATIPYIIEPTFSKLLLSAIGKRRMGRQPAGRMCRAAQYARTLILLPRYFFQVLKYK